MNADVFRAVSDPTRRQILDRLRARDLRTKELTAGLNMSQPAVSQHLRILRDAGLVTFDRRGRDHWYALQPTALREVYDWVEHYRAFWTEKLDNLGEILDARLEKNDESQSKG